MSSSTGIANTVEDQRHALKVTDRGLLVVFDIDESCEAPIASVPINQISRLVDVIYLLDLSPKTVIRAMKQAQN